MLLDRPGPCRRRGTPLPHRPACGALAVLLLLASAATHASGQATDPTAAAALPSGPIELYLVAAYGPGLVRPATGPTLTAKALNDKRISCQLQDAAGVKARAAGVSARAATAASLAPQATLAPVLAAAAKAAAASPAAASACRGAPLAGGRYNLVASYIPGATFARWNCYAMTPGVATAAAAEAAPEAAVTAQVVALPGGAAYTCVATYSRAAAAAVSAASAIDWEGAVASATVTASAITEGACRAAPFVPPKRAVWAKALAPITIKDNQLLANNSPLTIRGINWFGFNVAMGMVDGLWAGGTDLATDFGKITFQLKLLGYNAVRLPFTWNNLANTKVWDLVRQCTPTTAAQMKQRLVDPAEWAANANKAMPGNPAPLGDTSKGMCNDYLPMAKNEDRLLFVMNQFINLGMYVVLDYQPMGTEEHAYDLNRFVSAWAGLWKKISCLPNFNSDLAGRILVDVMNEPDSMGIRWEAQGDRPGAQQLYLGVADALWAATPNGQVRFLFEGTGQNSFGLNWGNGFVTDMNVINSRGLSNPNAFFKYLTGKPYTKWGGVIFTPHVYPPTITGNTFLGAELYSQCNTAFGYLQTTGYCLDGKCFKYPVFVGETGSAMSNPTDVQWLNEFSDYLNARGAAASYNSVPLRGWLWWAYNENSGDTGGIVMNGWQDVNWTKMRLMFNKFGLVPWYKQGTRRARVIDEAAPVDAVEPTAAEDAAEPAAAAAATTQWLPAAAAVSAAATSIEP